LTGNCLASVSSAATNLCTITGTTDERIGTDDRRGYLEVENLNLGQSVVSSINGNTFFAREPAVGGASNTIAVVIRDQAGNMGYATNDVFVSATTGGTTSSSSCAYDTSERLAEIVFDREDATTQGFVYAYDPANGRIAGVSNEE